MRRLLVVLVVLLLAVPALALASHTDPKRQINAVDQRKATSILLKRTDFAAGWKRQPNTPDSDDDHFSCPGYNPDQSDLVLTGDAEADFEPAAGFPSVSSIANIYKTRSQAVAAWTRTEKPALAPCLARMFKQEFEKEGARVAISSVGKVAFPRLAPRTSAYRVAMKVTMTREGKTMTLPLTIQIVMLGHGRGDATLLAASLGKGLSATDLSWFSKLLAQRLAAARL